ncbi:MAG: FkbM family methyltransferase [Terriglobales bacterium]
MIAKRLAVPLRRLKRKWRAVRGEDLLFTPDLHLPTVTLGSERAAWTFCPSFLNRQSVVYSFGVGEDISFDRELIERWGVTVHAFDPTPRSIAWIGTQTLPGGFIFHPYGVAAEDGLRRFHAPRDPGLVSHTLLDRNASSGAIEVPVQRLCTSMGELGHAAIDLLKMDIEGAEYEVVADLLACAADVRQLLIEFHHRWSEIGIDRTKAALRDLNAAGYRVFSVSASGEEYSFMKTSE